MPTAIVIDLTDQEYRLRPWPIYERLREEAPVHHLPEATADGEDFYVLSRYDDVALALRNKKLFSSHIRRGDFLDLPILVNRDAPDHIRLRHVANRAFNARLVRTLGDWVQDVVDKLVEELLSERKVEFVESFTTALPLRVVGGMLGIPLDRKADLRRWSQAVTDAFAVAGGMDPAEAPGFFEDFIEFGNYIELLANQRAGCPHRGDILDDLVGRKDAGDLSRDEMVGLGWSFVAAGHETTMNLLGGGVEMMLRDRAFGARMAAEPHRTEDFMEEYLRLFSPTQWVLRRTREDVVLHDVTIPAGALVHVVLGSANRDPRKFPDPDGFDLDRENKEDHMAFGGGPHFCPGSAIGRLFVGKAFRALYPHLDRLSLDPDDPPRLRTRQGSYGIAHMGICISHAQ
jgi:cytochrome P450